MKSKILTLILIIYSTGVWAQIKVPKSKTIQGPCWCEMVRYNEDTTAWRLYKIEGGTYHYFAYLPYGYRDKYGWDDAVARWEIVFKTIGYLSPDSKVSDTIPERITFSEYDYSCKCEKTWDEYRVGGFMGILIRSEPPKFSK